MDGRLELAAAAVHSLLPLAFGEAVASEYDLSRMDGIGRLNVAQRGHSTAARSLGLRRLPLEADAEDC